MLDSALIKETRTRLGLNQVEFSLLIGVHPITVSKWERSLAKPSLWQHGLIVHLYEANKFNQGKCRSHLATSGPIATLVFLLKSVVHA